ncbi:DUF2460 domain-containing protein [Ahrensia sp. R2A130]|uniref:DUF2460 domain-containing protein n=1 Tax=Ahrensia sp. R2A130 TaxID=744979 RepID=UPI0001E0E8C6|nr:DUF2460 domain-containing protein [Ahrensia sp. R2A130]EFL88964.1 glycoside hydrolase, family 24 [Ahrensia sp. R2A130]
MPLDNQFHDVRFPTDIALQSSGGPMRETRIVTLGSGREQRNQRWARSRRRFEAGYGVKDMEALRRVVAFYEARRGPLHPFRYRDPLDWSTAAEGQPISSDDELLGVGDGVQTSFVLSKAYGEEATSAYRRSIDLPTLSTLVIAVDGVASTLDQDFDADLTPGTVTFRQGHAPPEGATVTAGFEFDVPVRFEADELMVNLAAFTAGEVPSIPLMEVLL